VGLRVVPDAERFKTQRGHSTTDLFNWAHSSRVTRWDYPLGGRR
jgi:hypothetical protein